jgi:hypothetical protein
MAENRLPPLHDALGLLEAGDWDAAHRAVQDDPSADAAWIHAHLHRIEGDLANARYWYKLAGRPEATGPLDEERAEIQRALRGGNAGI